MIMTGKVTEVRETFEGSREVEVRYKSEAATVQVQPPSSYNIFTMRFPDPKMEFSFGDYVDIDIVKQLG